MHLLDGLTAPTFSLEDIPNLPEGEYFLKGETNSKKNDWNNSSYASSKSEIIRVANNILNDAYIGNQKIVVRPLQKYRRIGISVAGQPIFHERRIFILDGNIISEGYYWSNFVEDFGLPAIIDRKKYEMTLTEAIK